MATYTVKSGDTLSKIGGQFGVPYSQISGYRSGNPNLIYPGEVLNIPDQPGVVAAPASQAQPAQPQAQPQPVQPTVQPNAVQSSGQPQSAQDLINMGFAGYQGWGNAEAVADFKATGGQGKGGQAASGSNPMAGLNQARPAIPNFQSLYDTALTTATAGIQPQIDSINTEMDTRTAAFNDQVSKIKDNPYLSEASMTGRLSKLHSKYIADMELLTKKQSIVQGKLTQAKADAQIKLNIAQNQYQIESQQYQQTLSTFSSLLSSGAFIDASGQDIANASISTGIPTSMIQSIINKQKKDAEVKPSLQTVDDGTNQYVVAIDDKGNVINKSIIGNSKPKAATVGEKSEANLTAGNFTNSQISKAIKILAEADVATNPEDKGDKLLSGDEQRQALLKIQAEIVPDPTLAGQLLEKASIQGGFSDWTG